MFHQIQVLKLSREEAVSSVLSFPGQALAGFKSRLFSGSAAQGLRPATLATPGSSSSNADCRPHHRPTEASAF